MSTENSKLIVPGVWELMPGKGCSAFLVAGSEKALVIDTGMGETDIMAECRALTALPLELVNTHYHMDHTGRNADFGRYYMHPADIEKCSVKGAEAVPVTEGYRFELGGRTLEVLETPGHTPGSICLYDREEKIMFVGDTVSRRPIFLCEGDYELDDFRRSLERLAGFRDVTMFAAHDPEPNNYETALKLIDAMAEYRAGKLKAREVCFGMTNHTVYVSENGTGFLVP